MSWSPWWGRKVLWYWRDRGSCWCPWQGQCSWPAGWLGGRWVIHHGHIQLLSKKNSVLVCVTCIKMALSEKTNKSVVLTKKLKYFQKGGKTWAIMLTETIKALALACANSSNVTALQSCLCLQLCPSLCLEMTQIAGWAEQGTKLTAMGSAAQKEGLWETGHPLLPREESESFSL